MLSMHFLNLDSKMNKIRIFSLIDRVKSNLIELENELKSDPSSYLEGVTYQDILQYEDMNDDDSEEGL